MNGLETRNTRRNTTAWHSAKTHVELNVTFPYAIDSRDNIIGNLESNFLNSKGDGKLGVKKYAKT
jgi:hypothetical protein